MRQDVSRKNGVIRTDSTALSRESDAPPPRLNDAMDGLPELWAEETTKSRPEMLTGAKSIQC
jgi:hypothetical protein